MAKKGAKPWKQKLLPRASCRLASFVKQQTHPSGEICQESQLPFQLFLLMIYKSTHLSKPREKSVHHWGLPTDRVSNSVPFRHSVTRSSGAAKPRSPSRLWKEDGGQGGRQSSTPDVTSSLQDGHGAGPYCSFLNGCYSKHLGRIKGRLFTVVEVAPFGLPFYGWGSWGTERLGNLSKLIKGRNKIQTQTVWLQNLHFSPWRKVV